jgi:XTP/dITP diphosphohydrolase
MAIRIYAATTNQGKLKDFRIAALAHDLELEPIPDLKTIPAPDETGLTFHENAALKAIYYSHYAEGALVLADDSGLEVDALRGAPGVRSARYAADAGMMDSPDANDNTDVWNNLLVLQNLNGVPAERRTARYRCVLAVARNGVLLQTADGTVEGTILEAPRGTGGFGYDPIFYLPELGLTMAEVDLETKHTLSHRGRAMRALLPQFELSDNSSDPL